jgi:hypothetical protein
MGPHFADLSSPMADIALGVNSVALLFHQSHRRIDINPCCQLPYKLRGGFVLSGSFLVVHSSSVSRRFESGILHVHRCDPDPTRHSPYTAMV